MGLIDFDGLYRSTNGQGHFDLVNEGMLTSGLKGPNDEEEDIVTLAYASNSNPPVRNIQYIPGTTHTDNRPGPVGATAGSIVNAVGQSVVSVASGLWSLISTAAPKTQLRTSTPTVNIFHSKPDSKPLPTVTEADNQVGYRYGNTWKLYPGQKQGETNFDYFQRQEWQRTGQFKDNRSSPFAPGLPATMGPSIAAPSFPGRTITKQEEALAAAAKAKLLKEQAEASRKAYEEAQAKQNAEKLRKEQAEASRRLFEETQRRVEERAAALAAKQKAELAAKQKAEAQRMAANKRRELYQRAAASAEYMRQMAIPLPETTLPDAPPESILDDVAFNSFSKPKTPVRAVRTITSGGSDFVAFQPQPLPLKPITRMITSGGSDFVTTRPTPPVQSAPKTTLFGMPEEATNLAALGVTGLFLYWACK